MVNLELYKIFYTVAQTKNITKASEILNISQPAVTKHIQNLEYALNNSLFIRTKKGVILTEFGEKIFIKVKQALILLEDVNNQAQDYTNLETGTIKIGTSTTLMKTYISKYIEKFHQKYPNIIIDIYTDPTKTLIQKIKTGEIDIIINKFPLNIDKDLAYISLGQSNYIFIANKNYYKINKTISLKELTAYPILLQKEPSNSRASALKYFNQNNIEIKPKMNIASSNLLIDFVKMGFGIGYVTKLFANEELQNNELTEIKVNPAPPICEFGIIKLQNSVLNTACNKFIDTLLNKLD